jgi:MscS family membrane protein
MSDEITQIIITIGVLIAALILSKPIINFILNTIVHRITKVTKSSLDDYLIEALKGPLRWELMLAISQYVILKITTWTDAQISSIGNIFFGFYIFVGVILAIKALNSLSEWYLEEISPTTNSDLDNQLIPFLRRLVVIVIVAIGVIIFLGHFDIEVSGLVTTLGIGSLAVALAAQATLSDTISGFMIMIDRPFRIGDRIEIEVLNTWGDVVDIGLRSTRIRTRDNRMVVVPNSEIAKNLIVNHSFPDNEYRIQIEIGIAYGTDIEKARNLMVDTIQKVEGVLQNQPVEALFLNFGDSALIFRLRWWIESYIDTRQMFDKVNTALYKELQKEGIEIPFPQREIILQVDEASMQKFGKSVGK